jgi:hypothetical protein
MSRYFFHVVGRDSKFKDENGQHFGTLQDVAAHAAKIAAELAQDGDHYADFVVCITDENGKEVMRVTVKAT